MDRSDVRANSLGNHHIFDQVTLQGTGREMELIVAGLKVLAGQIAVRDAISEEPAGVLVNHMTYPTGHRSQGDGVALSGEVSELLAAIRKPSIH